ncbi:hypothetical protein DFQ30_001359 [Apophysomyces sp. BC1015]|nr:hypothetical protein DFQ30_001359 [Apophysomyces sp. BC1015]
MLPPAGPEEGLRVLADVADQAYHRHGLFAPETVLIDTGWVEVPRDIRDRFNNEQGIGLRSLAVEVFGMSPSVRPSVNKIIRENSLVPNLSKEPLHSMHGLSRGTTPKSFAYKLENYGAGIWDANFAMQAHEAPLGELSAEDRSKLDSRATFYHNPFGPFSEGVSVQIRRRGEERPFAILNYTGRQEHHTREALDRDQAEFTPVLHAALQRPPQPSMQTGSSDFQSSQSSGALSPFENFRNPWEQNSRNVNPFQPSSSELSGGVMEDVEMNISHDL